VFLYLHVLSFTIAHYRSVAQRSAAVVEMPFKAEISGLDSNVITSTVFVSSIFVL